MGEKITSGKVYNSFVWKLLERVFSQGINLVVQIILARLLLPSDFGSLAIIVAITNFAALFVQSGVGTVVIQKEDIDDKDIATLFSVSMGTALFLYTCLFFISPFIAEYYAIPVLEPALRVLGLILFLNSINSIQSAILSRKMKFKQLFLRSAIAVPISGVVGIVFALAGYGIWALVIHNLANMLIVVIIMSLDKDVRRVQIGFYADRAKKIYAFTIKILFTSAVSGMHDMLRTMIIGKKYTSNDLAYYDKAYTYSSYASNIVNSSMSSVLLPTFSRSQNEPDRLKAMSRKSVRLSAFLMIPAMIGLAMVAEPLITILLTSKWSACVPFFALFCILRIPTFVMTIDKQVYYALGRSDINLFYEIGLCLVNVLVLFISMQMGVIYIAMAATIVEYMGCVVISMIASKTYGYTIKERIADLWKPLLSASIMAIVVFLVGRLAVGNFVKLLLQVPVGVIVYILLSVLLKDQNIYEIKSLILRMRKKKD